MKNDGFTLIELLAVILILGIISLIAIPTVTNIIDESKKSSLKNSARNILSVTEDYVTKEYMSNNSVGTEYFRFPEDKKLELNNNPVSGYSKVIDGEKYEIAIDDGTYCAYKGKNDKEISIVKLEDKDCESYAHDITYIKKYSNYVGEGTFNENSMFSTEFRASAYKEKILSITFDYDLEVPDNKVASWDISEKGDNSIIAYLVNSSTLGYYDMYVTSHKDIYANPYSVGFFTELSKLERITFNNYNTSEVVSMFNMFTLTNLKELDLTSFNTSNVTNMEQMFGYTSSLISIDLSSFDTSKVTKMEDMFYSSGVKNLDLSSFDTSNVKNFIFFLGHCQNLETVNLSSFDTSKTEGFVSMFVNCNKLKELDISNFDTSKATDMSNMFYATSSIEHIYVGPKWKLADSKDNMFKLSKINTVTVKP